MNAIKLIARREVRTRLAEKSFRISMIVSLLAIVAIAVLPKVFAGDGSPWQVGAVGADNGAVADVAVGAAPDDREATAVPLTSDSDARQAVQDGTVDVAILADGTLLAKSEIDAGLEELLRQAVTTERLVGELEARGVPDADIAELAGPVTVETELLDPPDPARDRRIGFATVGVVLLFTQLIGYCYWVAAGVVEEKSSRVIEVLLAKVRPRDLLIGKVAGIGGLGLAQLLVFVAVGLGAFSLADRFPIPAGVWPLVAVVIVGFVLGYLLFASLFSIAGAMAARSEDLQATSTPFTLLLTGCYVAAMITIAEPAGGAARALSLVPFSAPMAMPLRIADGSVAAWEIALSAVLVIAAAYALVLVAERVYRGGVMRTERPAGIRELLRAS